MSRIVRIVCKKKEHMSVRCLNFIVSHVLYRCFIWSIFFEVFQQMVFLVDFLVGGSEHDCHKHLLKTSRTFNLAVFCSISEFLRSVFCSLLNLNSIRSVSSSVV